MTHVTSVPTIRVVGGIDTHKDLHMAAVVDRDDGRLLETKDFSTTRARASHWRAQFLAAGQAGLKTRDGCPGRRPSSAAGQDRRAADGDRVAVCEGGPGAALWPGGG